MPGLIHDVRGGDRPIIDCSLSAPGGAHPAVKGRALVDTGATHCVATPSFIAQCQLPAAGTIPQTVVGHPPRIVPTYTADVLFHGSRAMQPVTPFTYTVSGALILSDLLDGYDMILGWDVLASIDMTFGRDGTFLLRFG
jgi:hypothetical protein